MMKVNEVFVIHIERTDEGVSKGCFISPYIKDYVEFVDLGDMILKINRTLQMGNSQDEYANRICYHSLRDFAFDKKCRYFYLLEVLYTEHSSWQGRLSGTNCTRIYFKSVLDLLKKMNQSMEDVDGAKIIGMRG